MVSREDLKQSIILGYLTDSMLDKLLPFLDILRFGEGETIFREGDEGERFYILKRGKVLLEKRISDKMSISAGTVKPGYSFGWSAMLDGEPYTADAICAEPSEVFFIQRENISNLLDEDHSMGYILTQRIVRVVKRRLDYRTEQLLRALSRHPDIDNLISNGLEEDDVPEQLKK
jgi:CRP-like cAMP-binding protein